MSDYAALCEALRAQPRRWLVTGAAGFIGSHLVQELLSLGQYVTGIDDFSSGYESNLEDVAQQVGADRWKNFSLIEGDIRDTDLCARACSGIDYVLHHAAIGSVIKSFADPALTDSVNSGGFLSIMTAAARAGVKHLVFASSSAVYGDGDDQPRHENERLFPQSPYAVSKYANELYAGTLAASLKLPVTGLRYFNMYGPRQDPQGAYAAVIPKWIDALLNGKSIEIYGDGETVRDFCHVQDSVQANIRAAVCGDAPEGVRVYNIASGQKVTLNQLLSALMSATGKNTEPSYLGFRQGDIRLSCASIDKASADLGFEPSLTLADGIVRTVSWYGAQS